LGGRIVKGIEGLGHVTNRKKRKRALRMWRGKGKEEKYEEDRLLRRKALGLLRVNEKGGGGADGKENENVEQSSNEYAGL